MGHLLLARRQPSGGRSDGFWYSLATPICTELFSGPVAFFLRRCSATTARVRTSTTAKAGASRSGPADRPSCRQRSATCHQRERRRGSIRSAEQIGHQRQEQRRSFELELEQARCEARLAARRYEAVDAENRLVSAELEGRWNATLQKARERSKQNCRSLITVFSPSPLPDKEVLRLHI